MKKILTLILTASVYCSSYAQHCAGADTINNITPYAAASPGISPASDALPCHISGYTYYDTLYFQNYTTISGLAVDALTIDSIENLPAGFCWNTNKAGNRFLGGEAGVILIHGSTTAPAGQYKLRIKGDLDMAGSINLPNIDMESGGLRYYVRVACSNGGCVAIDTLQGQYNAYIPYTAGCTLGTVPVTASITAGGPTTFCSGGSVSLTANAGPGYTYLWSNGDSTISSTVYTSATYTVTVFGPGGSAIAAPVTVAVLTTCVTGGQPGITPSSFALPCITAGQPVNDTLHFINYTSTSGININSLKFDSIGDLPSGLSWTTDKPNNTFIGGDSGVIIISGTTTDSAGQYKLKVIVDVDASVGGNLPNLNAETMLGLRYYLKVACANGGCPSIDTVQGQYNQYIPYTTTCRVSNVPPVATITSSGATTICQGNTVTLTANTGPSYTYLWSTGEVTQSITVDTTGYYGLTVSNAGGNAQDHMQVNVVSCQGSGIPGFSPAADSLPCMGSGQYVSDTIYFTNYSTLQGLTLTSLKFDSIENLPAGLTWTCNKPNQTFAGGDSGYIEIRGFATGTPGQYKLRIKVDLNAAGINLAAIDMETLLHVRYYVRVSCSNNVCRAINHDTLAPAFIIDTICANQPVANISANGPTTFCSGGNVMLTANPGFPVGSGYSYLWSTGDTTQAITVAASGYYTVTAFYQGNTTVGTSPYIYVNPAVHAYFTLQPDANTPHVWYAVNQCTGSALSYVWSWGDSSTTTGATPSHTYSNSGTYTICVQIADSMGCSDYYCDSSTYLFKTENQMIQMSVLQYATGIRDIGAQAPEMSYYAGAIHFSEAIAVPTDVALYDLSGRVVMSQSKFMGSVLDVYAGFASGVYIAQLRNDHYTMAKKIMIIK